MSSSTLSRLGEHRCEFTDVVALAEQTPLSALLELIGRLAHAQAVATLRLTSAGCQQPSAGVRPLLTVVEVAARLRVSEANVYARAKTDLRSATVELGPGQLRFDSERLSRFVETRRRA